MKLQYFILAFALAVVHANAQWVPDSSVNTRISPRIITNVFEEAFAMVSDSSNGAIMIWQKDLGAYGTGISSQRVNASGVLQWDTAGVAISPAHDAYQKLAITTDGASGAIVTLYIPDSSHFPLVVSRLYANRLTSQGALSWGNSGVPIADPGWTGTYGQERPQIVSDGKHGAIIAWIDYRPQYNPTVQRVFAQRVNGAGGSAWTPNGIAVFPDTNQYVTLTGIISDGAGGAIITGVGEYSFRIYAQRVSNEGSLLWGNGVIVCDSLSGRQRTPKTVSDGLGGVIITWHDERNFVNTDIYAQRVNNAGQVQWATNGIQICNESHTQSDPRIISDISGQAIIAWTDFRIFPPGIYAQKVNRAGDTLWTANGIPVVTVSNNLSSTFADLSLYDDGYGGAVLAWSDKRVFATNTDIYAQRINAMGVVQWGANNVHVCSATGIQNFPTITATTSDGFIVAWVDNRVPSEQSIYGQRVNGNGTLGNLTSVAEDFKPSQFGLLQNYPNPFNPSTKIRYTIPNIMSIEGRNLNVQLKVYDVLGKEVTTLVNEEKLAGSYEVNFDAKNLSSGVYFYKLQAGSFVETKKMLLLK